MKKAAVCILMGLLFCTGRAYAYENVYEIFKYAAVEDIRNSKEWTVQEVSAGMSKSQISISAGKLIFKDNDYTDSDPLSVHRHFAPQSGKVYAEVEFSYAGNVQAANSLDIAMMQGEQEGAVFSVGKDGTFYFGGEAIPGEKLQQSTTYLLKISCDTEKGTVDYYLAGSQFAGKTGEMYTDNTGAVKRLYCPLASGVQFIDGLLIRTKDNIGTYQINSIGVSELARPSLAHPRLYVNCEKVAALRTRIETTGTDEAKTYARAVAESQQYSAAEADTLTQAKYHDGIRTTAEASALRYLLYQDTSYGEKAKQIMFTYLENARNDSGYGSIYNFGDVLQAAAIVYDWCYDLFGEEEKTRFINLLETALKRQEIGYPAVGSAVTGHSSGPQLMRTLLAASVAVYGDRNEMYDISAGKFFREYIDFRKFLSPAGFHPMGLDYGPGRYVNELYAQYIFQTMGCGDVFEGALAKIPYSILYGRRPDGQLFRDGDMYSDQYTRLGSYWKKTDVLGLAGSCFSDPLFQFEYEKQKDGQKVLSNTLDLVLFANASAGIAPETLPKSHYFSAPHASIIARTGWEADSAAAYMKIGGYQLNNHQHLDAGQFQLFYKGALAIDSGVYEGQNGGYFDEHDKNYNKRTIAHNCMLVYDPAEKFVNGTVGNDGGQRWPSNAVEPYYFDDVLYSDRKVSDVMAHEIQDAPGAVQYSYIKGDLTQAYQNTKVSEYQRSMLFLPMEEAGRPAAFIVLDRVKAVNPDFQKYWLLHSIDKPSVSGKTVTISRYSGGKLVNTAVLPEESLIETVGGSGAEFDVFGTNYNGTIPGGPQTCAESGKWRIQISPQAANKEDIFLNVMEMSDVGVSPLVVEKRTAGEMVGAAFGNKLVFFSQTGQKTQADIPFETTRKMDCIFADLAPGYWGVYAGAELQETLLVSETGGTAGFTAPQAGEYLLKKADQAQPFIPAGNIQVTNVTDTQAVLSWSLSNRDSIYEIYINGSLAGKTKEDNYRIAELSAASGYTAVIRTVAEEQEESEPISFTTAPKIPENLWMERKNQDLYISWEPSPGAQAYALQIDGQLYNGLSKPEYLLENGAKETRQIRVKACGETDSLWSTAYRYSGMLCGFEDESGLDGWTIRKSGNSDVRLDTADGRGCLALIDRDYSTANEYLSTASAQKETEACYGRVVFQTQFLFKAADHKNNNLEISVSGKDLQNASKIALRMYVFSDGAFGYTIAEGTPFRYFPGPNPMVKVKNNTWVNVTAVMDTRKGTIDLTVQSDMYKDYKGVPWGEYDAESGTCKVSGIPFYSQDTSAEKKPNVIVALDKILLASSRYTGEYYFDNVDMYMENKETGGLQLREISAEKTGEGAVQFIGQVGNLGDKEHTAVFAVAEYDSAGRLLQVEASQQPVVPYETLPLIQNIRNVRAGSILKAFVWDEKLCPAGPAGVYPVFDK